MRLVLAFVASILAGCGSLQVDFVFVESEVELRQHCGDDMIAEPLGCAKGGALVVPHSTDCTVYAYRPRAFDDHRRLETLGHEVLHCLAGSAHI